MKEKNNSIIFRSKIIVIAIIMVITSISTIAVSRSRLEVEDVLTYSFEFAEPDLNQVEVIGQTFTAVSMPGTYSSGLEVGNPNVQIKPIKLLIPAGKEIKDISVTYTDITRIDTRRLGINLLQRPIAPYQKPVRIGEKPTLVLEKNQATYTSKENYPGVIFENVGLDYCKGYSILSLNLYPIQYNPGAGLLSYYSDMIVNIKLTDADYSNELFRGNTEDEAWVQNLVSNPDLTQTYSSSGFGETLYDGGLCDPSDNGGLGYDYVIICREALSDLTGEQYTWNDFIARKQTDGLETTIVTVEDILATADYENADPLFNDEPARIREFCKDAYQDWGTEYILIAGDQEGTNRVERRLMAYEDESDVESDIYFTHLDNTFNEDGDNLWGERGDGGFDLYSELYSGSLPCDDPVDLSNWMKKSFFYADALDIDYLENAAFYGGDTGWSCQGDDFIDYSAIKGTDNWLGPDPDNDGPYPSWVGFQYGFETWNANNPGLEYNLSVKWTAEPPNTGGWMGGSETAAIEGLRNAINDDKVTLLSAIAHANSGMSMDVHDYDWESEYHNTKPFFLHDYGCHCGDMDAEDDGVLHSMLFHSDTELAFATVYNTGYGWGNLGSTNSSSALQQKSFWDYLFDVTNNSGGTMNWQLGKAQEWARDFMAPTINWDPSYGTWRGIIESCLLFGDPAQLIKPPMSADHNVGVQEVNVDSHVTPDVQTTVGTTIVNNGNNDENNIVVSFRVDGIEQDSQTISSMASQSTEYVSFDWTPTLGSYLVTINATITGVQEEFYFDNEKSKIVIAGPDVAVTNLNTPTYAGLGVATPITADIENFGATSESITVNLLVDGNIDDVQTVSLNSGETQGVSFNWIPAYEGMYPVGISVEVAGYEPYTENNEQTNDVTVFVSKGHILLVDDDEGDAYETYYTDALLASSYLYDYWNRDNSGSPTESEMNVYDAVVWFTGDDYTSTLLSEDRTNLENYLDAGGRLFISGQDIGYDIRNDGNFYSDYLHAEYNVDDTNIFTLDGTPGDPIGDGLIIDISSGDGANNQNYPEGISPISPADAVFTYESSTHDGGIKTDAGTYKNVYFGFGFEAISNQNDRTVVMDRVLSWLVGTTTSPILSYAPSSYDFGGMDEGTTNTTNFDIWNSGSGTLNYTLSTTESWIDVLPISGSSDGETDTVQVTIDTTGLTIGPHTGQVNISSNGGSGTFIVYLTINNQGTEILDIEQSVNDRGFPIRHAIDGSWGGAQSFKPTVSTITRAEVYLRMFGTPTFDLMVEIHQDSIDGPLVDTLTYTPAEVPATWSWFELDFTDVSVTPGTTYFIKIPPPSTNPGNSFGYEWGYAFGNQYDDGAFWFTRDGGGLWRDLPDTYEFTFKTYGIE